MYAWKLVEQHGCTACAYTTYKDSRITSVSVALVDRDAEAKAVAPALEHTCSLATMGVPEETSACVWSWSRESPSSESPDLSLSLLQQICFPLVKHNNISGWRRTSNPNQCCNNICYLNTNLGVGTPHQLYLPWRQTCPYKLWFTTINRCQIRRISTNLATVDSGKSAETGVRSWSWRSSGAEYRQKNPRSSVTGTPLIASLSPLQRAYAYLRELYPSYSEADMQSVTISWRAFTHLKVSVPKHY